MLDIVNTEMMITHSYNSRNKTDYTLYALDCTMKSNDNKSYRIIGGGGGEAA